MAAGGCFTIAKSALAVIMFGDVASDIIWMTIWSPSILEAWAITSCKGLIPLDSQACLVSQNTTLFFMLVSVWIVSTFLQEYSLGASYWQQSPTTNRIRLNFVTNGSKKRGSCDFIWASLTTCTAWTADQICSYIDLHIFFSKKKIHQIFSRAALSTTKSANTVCIRLVCFCTPLSWAYLHLAVRLAWGILPLSSVHFTA